MNVLRYYDQQKKEVDDYLLAADPEQLKHFCKCVRNADKAWDKSGKQHYTHMKDATLIKWFLAGKFKCRTVYDIHKLLFERSTPWHS